MMLSSFTRTLELQEFPVHCLARGKEYVLIPTILWRYALGISGRGYDCVSSIELMPTSFSHAISTEACPQVTIARMNFWRLAGESNRPFLILLGPIFCLFPRITKLIPLLSRRCQYLAILYFNNSDLSSIPHTDFQPTHYTYCSLDILKVSQTKYL